MRAYAVSGVLMAASREMSNGMIQVMKRAIEATATGS